MSSPRGAAISPPRVWNLHTRPASMAIQAEFDSAGVDQASYDSMIPQVEAKLRTRPGFIAHVAKKTSDGFRVTEVWESQAALDAWLQEVISPMMQGAGSAAPRPNVEPVHHVIVNSPG